MRALLAACGLALAIAGCGLLDPGSDGAASDLERARRLWATSGVTDYDLRLERICFCLPVGIVTVEVRNGVRTGSWVDVEGGREPLDDNLVAWYPTVDELFGLVDDAIVNRAAELRVTYHPVLGYPVDLWVDRSTQIADEEFGYEATLGAPAAGS